MTNAPVSLKGRRALQREISPDLMVSLMSKLPDVVNTSWVFVGMHRTAAMRAVVFWLGGLDCAARPTVV